MAIGVSYAQTQPVPCPACGRSFNLAIWLIVDTAERPDLLARIRDGTIHAVVCSHCGAELGHAAAPLLLYRPDVAPHVLFSPAQGTTAEQDREHAARLLEMLRERLGDEWRDEWVARGLRAVRRPDLPAALGAFQEEGAEEEPGQPDEARAALAARETLAGLPPEARARALIEKLLAREPIALQADDLDDTLFAALDALIAEAEERKRQLETLREQLQAMRRQVERALSAMRELAAAGELGQHLLAFIQASTWDASQHIVEEHPDLLSDEADALLGQLLDAARSAGGEGAVRTLAEHRDLLRRCREVGIPRAFAEKVLPPEALAAAAAAGLTPEQALEAARRAAGSPLPLGGRGAGGEGIPLPPPFLADLQQAQEAETRYRRTGDRAALDEAAAAWERILGHPDFPAADERFQLAALNDAGNVYLRRYWARGRPQDLDRALALWQTAVVRTPPDHPDLPSRLNNLGNGLRARYARTGQLADLEEAIGSWRQAVQRTPPDHPDLPSILNNLGTGLRARYACTGQLAGLEEAIASWQTALDRLHAVICTGLEAAPLAGQAAAITRRLVAAYLTLGRPAAALAAAEKGRGVRLRQDLARSGRVPAGLDPAEADEYRRLVEEVRAVASQRRLLDREGLPPAEHAARLAELGQRHAAATARLNALEARDPSFGRTLNATDIAALARQHDLTLVFLVPTDEPERGTVALIVPPSPLPWEKGAGGMRGWRCWS